MTTSGPGDSGDRTAVFQVNEPAVPRYGPHTAPDRRPEQRKCSIQRDELVRGDLLRLQLDSGQGRVVSWPAVEQEPDAAGVSRTAGAEVGAGQPAAVHLDAALLAHLPTARVPWRLPVRFHDAARYRPARLVGRLEDQQPPCLVEDQCPGGHR